MLLDWTNKCLNSIGCDNGLKTRIVNKIRTLNRAGNPFLIEVFLIVILGCNVYSKMRMLYLVFLLSVVIYEIYHILLIDCG